MSDGLRQRQAVRQAREAALHRTHHRDPLAGDAREAVSDPDGAAFLPSFRTLVLVTSAVRIVSALVNVMGDCDEVYNYYEPLHYLLFGFGFQTWEYDERFALRSYAYLLPDYVLVTLLRSLYANKLLLFFLMRAAHGFLCANVEAMLVVALRVRLGRRVARATWLFLLASPGVFMASTAFMPASTTMMALMGAVTAYLLRKHFLAVALTAFSAVGGWPYPAVLALPLGLHILAQDGLLRAVAYCVGAAAATIVPSVLIDYAFYRRWVFPSLNAVMYNVFGGEERSSNLYGTEPWTYYPANLVLNMNIAFPLAVLGLGLLAVRSDVLAACLGGTMQRLQGRRGGRATVAALLAPLLLWALIVGPVSHKEERFLFPIYPFLAISAAMLLTVASCALDALLAMVGTRGRIRWGLVEGATALLFASSLALGASRVASMTYSFYAPLGVFTHLNVLELGGKDGTLRAVDEINVCIGGEWHRFPSHFFIPDDRVKVLFLRSDFGGQLPQYYLPHAANGTSVSRSNFNDLNKEETDRYASLDDCHYWVGADGDLGDGWDEVMSIDMLDAAKSPTLSRAFLIPGYSIERNAYMPFRLLKQTSKFE